MTGEFPAQMANNAEMFPFDDVIMTYSSLNLDENTINLYGHKEDICNATVEVSLQ